MTTLGTVVVVVVVVFPVPIFGAVVGTVFGAVVDVIFGTVVGAAVMATSVVVVVVATVVVVAPLMVVLRLALPWKTARMFLETLLSRSGRITAALSIIVPVPGIV